MIPKEVHTRRRSRRGSNWETTVGEFRARTRESETREEPATEVRSKSQDPCRNPVVGRVEEAERETKG